MSGHDEVILVMAQVELRPDVVELIAARAAEIVASPLSQNELWLGVAEAAEYLAAPPSRIYDLVAQGRIRVARDGRRLLFRREWLDSAVEDGLT